MDLPFQYNLYLALPPPSSKIHSTGPRPAMQASSAVSHPLTQQPLEQQQWSLIPLLKMYDGSAQVPPKSAACTAGKTAISSLILLVTVYQKKCKKGLKQVVAVAFGIFCASPSFNSQPTSQKLNCTLLGEFFDDCENDKLLKEVPCAYYNFLTYRT